ncbi:13294_t:CDS:2 [Cetraspora pellucida]|uniref:13294_t:CDS:1 n=1 Tax=Cetraspora pellucida TaxID=1433469 RepID=A0ACA9KS98_9GLOM|nr:13294_t:CDS:2 [Cetraspora pellucida]
MENQLTTQTSTACQCYFNIFLEEKPLCKGDLRIISSSTPVSEEQHQKLEGKYLCQTHYNQEQQTKKKGQTKTKDALINLPVRFCKVLELDSTTKICHRCIKFTDNDSDYVTNHNYIPATKWLPQTTNTIQKKI